MDKQPTGGTQVSGFNPQEKKVSKTQTIESLHGTVEKVLFKSADSGFSILKVHAGSSQLRAANQGSKSNRIVTVTGYLPDLHAGEYVELEGSWGFHQKFGRQFQAKSVRSTLPSSVLGIQKYLGSGLIKGIGPKFAERLVTHFQEKTLEIIDKYPNRLFEVSGVGARRVELITKAWQEQKEISAVMVFLHGYDVSTAFAVKIYKKYGDESIAVVKENPYRLVEDIWGVGFKTADKLALALGIDQSSLQRVRAGILHVIGQVVDSGHLYIDVAQLKPLVAELLGFAEEQNSSLVRSGLVALYNQDKIKLISHNNEHTSRYHNTIFLKKGSL